MNRIAQKLERVLYFILCYFGFHKWEIIKWCKFRDKKCKYLLEEGFNRECKSCGKVQTLKRPKKYHPIRYVWTDLDDI